MYEINNRLILVQPEAVHLFPAHILTGGSVTLPISTIFLFSGWLLCNVSFCFVQTGNIKYKMSMQHNSKFVFCIYLLEKSATEL